MSMESRVLPLILLACAVVAAACGGAEPTPIPVPPTTTPQPTATSTPQPTPTSTPAPPPTATPFPAIGRADLPGMVLPQLDVDSEFPNLPLNIDSSGYEDSAAAVEGTIDPNDTDSDLGFLDLFALLSGETGRVMIMNTSVHLFDTPEWTRAFLQSEIEDFSHLQGGEVFQEGGECFFEISAVGRPRSG